MSPVHLERIESAVRTVIAFNEAFNRHDVPAMLQLTSEDCVFESPSPAPDGIPYKGHQAIMQYWQDFFIRFPQAHRQIEQSLGFGLHCIMLWRQDSASPDGTKTHLRGVDIFRVQNNLIYQDLSYIKE